MSFKRSNCFEVGPAKLVNSTDGIKLVNFQRSIVEFPFT